MKKIIAFFLILTSSFFWMSANGQRNDIQAVIDYIQETRMSKGDSVARQYVDSLLKNPKTNADLSESLTIIWGVLTSSIWQTNQTDSITNEYRQYLEKVIIPIVSDDITLKKIIDESSIDLIARFTYDYALMVFDDGEINKSADLLKKTVSWYDSTSKVRGNPQHINFLSDYCSLLINFLHQYENALPYVEKNIQLIASSYGNLSQEYALALCDKAICLGAIDQHKESVAIAKTALDIYRKTSDINPQVITQLEDFVRTKELLMKGSACSADSVYLHRGLLSISECMSLIVSGREEEAIPSLLSIKRDMEHMAILDTLSYASIVLTLSSALLSTGNINEARDHIEELNQKINLKKLPQLYAALYFNNLSLINYYLKRNLETIQYGKKAIALYSRVKEHDLEYIKALSNISLAYREIGEQILSKWYNDEAIELFKNYIDSNIYDNATALMFLNNKASICSDMQEDAMAEKIWSKIVNNSTNKYRNATAYDLASNNLAHLYFNQNRWIEAIPLLENLKSENKEHNYIFYQNLILAYLYSGQIDSAVFKLKEFNSTAINNCTEIYSHFIESERENYWHKIAEEVLLMNNLIGNLSQNDSAISLAYNNKLFCSNLSIANHSYLLNKVASSNSSELYTKYLEYKKLKNLLSYKKLSNRERQDSTKKYYELERDVINLIPDLNAHLRNSAGTWQDVKESLSYNELAVEFIIIPNSKSYTDITAHYGAFVLKKEYQSPRLILLDEVSDVEEIIFNNNPNEIFINKLYGSEIAIQLYEKIWKKIELCFGSASTIYYSPTGSLLNINFDLLKDDNGVLLTEKYDMVRVSSTKNIFNCKNQSKSKVQSASLYGNISYDETVAEMATESSKYSTYSGENITEALSSRSIDDRGKWGALPYTKNEIDSIYSILSNNNINIQKFEAHNASEESFKTLNGKSPDIIHLATHGFVIDTETKANGNKFVASTSVLSPKEGYLMWCGLMMAGANNAWTGNFNLENVEDGILTADEISRLDLSNTKLVVLSACETARGKIDPVEGVLGLQRAFKKAGAQTIVMSLWKVPDEATSMLMTQFYKGLMAGTERHQALKDAMNYVKKLYPDPYYWAGFIMLD